MAVVDAASASGDVGERTLAVGASVFIGDVVKTDNVGEAQLLFEDGTRMVVGPNSSLVIDEFLFRGKAAENKFSVRALGGAFRFISGESGDKGYSIRTPSATIGVRGTAFDFTVTPEGETNLVLLSGEAELCESSGNCKTVASRCGFVRTTGDSNVEQIKDHLARARATREIFPYMVSQDRLLDPFRLDGEECTADHASIDNGIEREQAVAAAPALDPAPAPAPEPAPEPAARGNNGFGNGPEPDEAAGPVGTDPSNPGKGATSSNAGGKGRGRDANG
ncbi:MAG TPA: FecR domain-containing protein [Thermohalobaculum sp.]|nr:FecR domain-containing protein [Thermohalobaculum sp.]